MRKAIFSVLATLTCIGLMVSAAEASTIRVDAVTINGNTGRSLFQYTGTGDLDGDTFGEGFYRLGDCVLSSGITTCTTTGTYLVRADSDFLAGTTGTFSFREVFPGSTNPIKTESTATANTLTLLTLGTGQFQLDLVSALGPAFSYTGQRPPVPGPGLAGWSAFITNPLCTGTAVPGGCSIDNVGKVGGAILTADLNFLYLEVANVNAPTASSVPEPSTWVLLGSGIAALVARRRLRS